MSKIIRILFKFESEYAGSPQYISGNALRHALSLQVNSSIGIFTAKGKLTKSQSYNDFFLLRTRKYFLRPYFEIWWDKIQQKKAYRCFFLPQFVTFDIINPPENFIKIIKNIELLQLGGMRNVGFGIVSLQDHIEINLDELDYPKKASHLTLISPAIYLPSFVELYDCRHKQVEIWNHNNVNVVNVIAPGQFFRIRNGKNIQSIAKKGILRKAALGKLGLGEYIVHDWKNN
ncbi:MAG: hypothetical protein HWN66_09475 [Candidatus Helarchaeota archaeon]|nr:hypothetical protein [Candidatus Helarchaeota archaeon]